MAGRDGSRGGGGGGGSAANLGICLPTLHNPEKKLPRTAAGPDGGLFSDGGEVGWSAPAALQRLRPLEAFPPTRTAGGGGGEAPRVPSGPLDVAFDPRTNWLVLPHLPLDGGVHSRFKPSPDGRLHDHAWSLFFYNLHHEDEARSYMKHEVFPPSLNLMLFVCTFEHELFPPPLNNILFV